MKAISGFVGLVTLAAAVGCGGPGSFNGTVTGLTLDVKSSAYLDAKDSNGKVVGVVVFLTDQADICRSLEAGTEPKGMNAFAMEALVVDASGNLVAPASGSYEVFDPSTSPQTAGNFAIAVFAHLDSSCVNTVSNDKADGHSGTVHLDALTLEKSASGSFDISMGSQGDHVTGSFDAAFCNADANATLKCG